MATPLSGITSPGFTVSAYKAARFGTSEGAAQAAFPQPPYQVYAGSLVPNAAPGSPDATTTADAITGAWVLSAPTAEDYIVAFITSGNVSGILYVPYEFTNAQKRLLPGGGAGNVSAAGNVVTFTAYAPATYTSADLNVSELSEIDIDFDVTVQATGSAQLFVDRKAASGVYETIATCVAATGVASQALSIGKGFPQSATLGTATGQSAFSVSESLEDVIRIRVIVTTGNCTATLSLKAK
jgi:hypothetical protein